jgi:hypothetical protein
MQDVFDIFSTLFFLVAQRAQRVLMTAERKISLSLLLC